MNLTQITTHPIEDVTPNSLKNPQLVLYNVHQKDSPNSWSRRQLSAIM
jgi:hypothetical protein